MMRGVVGEKERNPGRAMILGEQRQFDFEMKQGGAGRFVAN